MTPSPSRPMRFRRARVLLVGLGDVGQRSVQRLNRRVRVLATTSQPQRVSELRSLGVTPLVLNMDQPGACQRLAALASRALVLVPPPAQGRQDTRSAALVAAWRRGPPHAKVVYASTSGVYGDCGGAWVDETRAVAPTTPRALRRVDAEQRLRALGVPWVVLRVPGIYALDRVGGSPAARLQRAAPVLQASDDVYTNHIHATDLARACLRALWQPVRWRTLNVSDNSAWRMGDYFDHAAQLLGLPPPPRISRVEAEQTLPEPTLSFMRESRRLRNTRLTRELKLQLRYPTPLQGLASG